MAVMNCPHCERGQVQPEDPTLTRCSACGRTPERWIQEILEEIISLPDAVGSHACEECAHPQMCHLPDGTFRCPGCGEEVLSLDASLSLWEFRQKSAAYRQGWLDGFLLGEEGNSSSSTQMVMGQAARERLDYFKGHRAGSEQHFLLLEQATLQAGSPSEKVRPLKEAS